MNGPWDQYAAPASGPWTQYAAAPNSRQSGQLSGGQNGPQFESVWQQGAKAAGISPRFTNAVQDFGVGVAEGGAGLGDFLAHLLPIPGIAAHEDAQVQALQQYEAERQSSGEGNGVANTLGQIASPVNYAPIGDVGRGVGIAEKLGKLAVQGGISGAASATDPSKGNYLAQKFAQIATGAAGSALGGALLHGAATGIEHAISGDADRLLQQGIRLTPGQAAGGLFKRAEDALSSVPILGQMIRGGQNNALRSFNRAAINRALAPIGQELPKNLDAGRDAIAHARQVIGQHYENLNKKMIGVIDPELHKQISSLTALATNLPAKELNQYQRILQSEVLDRFTPQGRTTGSALQKMESTLGTLSKTMLRSTDYDQQALGGAVKQLREHLLEMRDRVNPQFAGEMQKANAAWANFKRVQRAATSLGGEPGIFSPAQLLDAVKAGDASKDKSAFGAGSALMQDLAEGAKKILPAKLADSGTAERAATMGGLGEALFHAPQIAESAVRNPLAALAAGAGAAVAALPYTSAGMDLLAKYGGPETRNMLARRIASAEPYVTGALGVTRAQQPNQTPNQ